jgi:hypothetical protein
LGLALLGWGREGMSEAGPSAAKPGHQWRPTRSGLGRKHGGRRWDLLVEGASGSQRRTLWLGYEEAGPGSRGWARDAGHWLRVATGGVSEPDHRARAGPKTPARAAARDTAHPYGGDDSVAAGWRSTNCAADPGLESQQW